MITFLFWNLHRKDLLHLLAAAAADQEADVVIVAENGTSTKATLAALRLVSPDFNFCPDEDHRVEIYAKFSRRFVKRLYHTSRYTIRGLILPGRQPVILAAVHLPSQLNSSPLTILVECQDLAQQIEILETKFAHDRTIVIGDMNLNPFDQGLIAASGLHAVMNRSLVESPSRTVLGKTYKKFYSPMWSHFGDRNDQTSGTFYYPKADQDCLFWHLFDQILLRPELALGFKHEDFRILRKAGSVSLVRPNGTPNETIGSDHLPIALKLNF